VAPAAPGIAEDGRREARARASDWRQAQNLVAAVVASLLDWLPICEPERALAARLFSEKEPKVADDRMVVLQTVTHRL
jgi:uncharacterized protein (DUF2267 family)